MWMGSLQQFWLKLQGLKKVCFEFCEGVTLMTHRVTPPTCQLAACSLLAWHFWIESARLVPGPTIKNHKSRVELSSVGTSGIGLF